MDESNFEGVYVAMVTPMDDKQLVDYDRLAEFADYLVNEGVHGIIPLGSTGEFYALTDHERAEVLRVTIDAVSNRVPVIAGTNASSTQMVINYSQLAEKAGADGLLIAPPYYSLPTPPELLAHFKAVNDSVGLPIMLYNYPGRAGVDITPDQVEALARLSNVQYIKESTGDSTRVSEIISRCGDSIKVFAGGDCVALELLALGAIGWVGGIANVLPREHVKLYNLCVKENDYIAAREFLYKILHALAAVENSGKYTQFVKAGCAVKGHPVGPPRMPLLPASPEEIILLGDALQI